MGESRDVCVQIHSSKHLISYLQAQKEYGKKDLVGFCRDKAIELLAGYYQDGEEIYSCKDKETNLKILQFLASLRSLSDEYK